MLLVHSMWSGSLTMLFPERARYGIFRYWAGFSIGGSSLRMWIAGSLRLATMRFVQR